MNLWVHDGVFATEILYELERYTEFDKIIWESGSPFSTLLSSFFSSNTLINLNMRN